MKISYDVRVRSAMSLHLQVALLKCRQQSRRLFNQHTVGNRAFRIQRGIEFEESGARSGVKETFSVNIRKRSTKKMAEEERETPNIVTVCATVNSGFEYLAAQECREKLGSETKPKTVKGFRGRILFELPFTDVKKASALRSVNNLSVVVGFVQDIDLSQEKEKAIQVLCNKIEESNWSLALDTWAIFTETDFCLDPLPSPCYEPLKSGELLSKNAPEKSSLLQETTHATEVDGINENAALPEDAVDNSNSSDSKLRAEADETSVTDPSGSGTDPLNSVTESSNSETAPSNSDERTDTRIEVSEDLSQRDGVPQEVHVSGIRRPTFRVTCTRTGERHQFNSRDIAPAVGSLINEKYGWPVKMKEYDIEVLVNILENSILLALSLTSESMHKRNITHFGYTTLKSTIAYCMIKMAAPQAGEIICDPMCGCGSIPLEGLIDWKSCYVLAGDNHDVAVERTKANYDAQAEKRKRHNVARPDLENDVFQWDVTNLPLKTASVDVFVTDLPFGKRMGTKRNNWSLYLRVLEEMARVCTPGTGRAVLLTQDKKCMTPTLQRCSHLWRKKNLIFINQGGLKVCVYLLQRSKVKDQTRVGDISQDVKPSQGESSDKDIDDNELKTGE